MTSKGAPIVPSTAPVKLELLHALPATATDRPPLLLVHGSYCGAWVWEESFLPALAQAGYPTYAVSLRGHGRSEGDATFASLADYIQDVESAIDRLGGRCILIGHSMGGLIAQHCLRPGHGLAGLVLLSSVPPNGLAGAALNMMLASPELWFQFGLLQSLGPAAVSAALIRKALFADETPDAEVLRLLPRFQSESLRIAFDLTTPPPLPRPDPAVPVLVLGGTADPLIPLGALHQTAAHFRAELAVLEGAPHGVMLDPAWVAPTLERIISWLQSYRLHGKTR